MQFDTYSEHNNKYDSNARLCEAFALLTLHCTGGGTIV